MIDIEGIKARLDIAENGIKCAEQTIENAKACFDKAKEMLDAKEAKPPSNWPERIEAGMCFGSEFTTTTWMATNKEGLFVCLRGESDSGNAIGFTTRSNMDTFRYLGHARDILAIRTDTHEPTGAELVGKVCEFSDDGDDWTDGARPREQGDPRICIGYDENAKRPYSNKWADWKLARLAK